MTDAFEEHNGPVSSGGQVITNMFVDDIDELTGEEKKTLPILWKDFTKHLPGAK